MAHLQGPGSASSLQIRGPIFGPERSDSPPLSHLPKFNNGVYFPNWHAYKNKPLSSLKPSLVTHLFYAFARVRSDGVVELSDSFVDLEMDVEGGPGCLHAFLNLRKLHPHLEVILSIGGAGPAGQHFATVAADPVARETFAQTARALVLEYGLNGIDVDWEHPSDAEQGSHYLHLLQVIREYLPVDQFTVCTAWPAGQWALRHIDVFRAQKYLDFINLMDYDFSGPWSNASGHHAQLYAPQTPHPDPDAQSCQLAVDHLFSRKVDPRKIVLGIALYGRAFPGTTGVGQKFTSGDGQAVTFDYADLPRPGTQEQVDRSLGAAYCVSDDGGFISYDNHDTATMKAHYVLDRGLGGLFYWACTMDAEKPRSLVEAGFEALGLP